MTELWLVRHGETDWNREGRLQGHGDPPLNATGLAQAERVADMLAGRRVDAVWSSDLRRARQTADAIARTTGVPVHLDPRLREVDHGEWSGLVKDDVAAMHPSEWSRWASEPLTGRPPGGESVLDVARRVGAAADDIQLSHPSGRVVVVSHGLALAALRCRAEGVPLERARSLIPPNAEPVRIMWSPADSDLAGPSLSAGG